MRDNNAILTEMWYSLGLRTNITAAVAIVGLCLTVQKLRPVWRRAREGGGGGGG